MIINKLTFLKATTITRTRITKEEKRKKISSPILPEGGSSPITRLPIFRKRHTTIDKSKRTASTTDLQGHCNLRQNRVSSASSYRVICVRLQCNLHHITRYSDPNSTLFCVKPQRLTAHIAGQGLKYGEAKSIFLLYLFYLPMR